MEHKVGARLTFCHGLFYADSISMYSQQSSHLNDSSVRKDGMWWHRALLELSPETREVRLGERWTPTPRH